MRTQRTFLVLTSSGILGAAVAGVVWMARWARQPLPALWYDWGIDEADVLLDLQRLT